MEKEEFFINPFGLLYSEVAASSLVKVNTSGAILDMGSTHLGVNRSGVELHSTIYRARRDVKCIMHLHTVAGAAVCTLCVCVSVMSVDCVVCGFYRCQ